MIIQNSDELTSKGNIRGRETVLKIIDGALEQVNSYDLIMEQVKLNDDLRIGPLRYELKKIKDIFLIGGGKQVTFAAVLSKIFSKTKLEKALSSRRKGAVAKPRRLGWWKVAIQYLTRAAP